MSPEQVNEAMRRCPALSVEAAIKFQSERDPALVPQIVLGIIERFVEPDMRAKVAEARDETRLFDDLGIDSLIMVEIVMTIEQVLGVSAPDEELRGLRTIGDVKLYLDAKLRGVAYDPGAPRLDLAAIAAALPQQPPFLFLQTATINADGASGSYHISGDEPVLRGHFRDEPVFPASLMMESLGQLAALYLIKSGKTEFAAAAQTGKAWFISAESVRCMRICRPGETLSLSVRLVRQRAPLAVFAGTIDVDGQRTASIEALTLACGQLASPAEAPAVEEPASDSAKCEA